MAVKYFNNQSVDRIPCDGEQRLPKLKQKYSGWVGRCTELWDTA